MHALIAERIRYSDIGMGDLGVEYRNTNRVAGILARAGWPPGNVEILADYDGVALAGGLRRLASRADDDDLVFVYLFGHGRHLAAENEVLSEGFARIPAGTKVLVVDACRAAAVVGPASGPGVLAVGAVGEEEFAWAGVEEEGLPVLGGVFTHFFTAAFSDPRADSDGNGRISVVEAARRADATQREYLREQVFPVPAFLEMFHRAGVRPEEDPGYPRVTIRDGAGGPVHLSRP